MSSSSAHRIFTPNPEICLKATRLDSYKNVLNSADLNLPDGFGLKLGAKILGTELQNRVTGVDFTKQLLDDNNTAHIFVLLLSYSLTRPKDLELFFNQNYPNIKLACAISKKTDIASTDLLKSIEQHKTQVLFVCLGAPEQEFWIEHNLNHLPSVKLALAVGGSFDFLCEKIKRAPMWMRELGMEWLYRLYQEPKRLIRIKHATADFLLECHKWANRIKKEYRANVLGVIKNEAGQFLIQKNSRLENHWQFPQGGVDESETAEVAVVREISEELGIKTHELVIAKKLTAEHTYKWAEQYQLLRGYKGQTQIAFLLKYSGQLNSSSFQPTNEVSEIKWVDKIDLLKSLHPVRQEFVKKFINEI